MRIMLIGHNKSKNKYDYPFSSASEKAGGRGIGCDKLKP